MVITGATHISYIHSMGFPKKVKIVLDIGTLIFLLQIPYHIKYNHGDLFLNKDLILHLIQPDLSDYML